MSINKDLKVLIVGMGYIGLPTAALIASHNIKVTGVDTNQDVVDTINRGKIHIVEPDLSGLVKYVFDNGYLTASSEPVESDVCLITVPTPFSTGYKADLSYVENAIDNIAKILKPNDLVIIESTSPVGTTEKMLELLYAKRSDLEGKIFMAYCPERVLPGKIIYELENNDRVIGGVNVESTEKATQFYRTFVKGELHQTNARTAEMCKLVENSSRDVQIAFANELSMICDQANINVWELIKLANKHPRVNILLPGTGVGGHCIAVDPWFIVNDFKEHAILIRNAREINISKTKWVIDNIKSKCFDFQIEHNRNPKVACLGLAFKPDIDDLRESPALQIVQALIHEHMNVMAVEPNIENHAKIQVHEAQVAVDECDIVILLVNHKTFLDLRLVDKIVIDYCGYLETKKNS